MAGEIQVEIREAPATGRVAFVTIAHEAKLNTLNPRPDAGFRRRHGRGCGGRGAARRGADRRRAEGLRRRRRHQRHGGARGRRGGRGFITLVHGCCRAVRDCPVPVIGRINGWTPRRRAGARGGLRPADRRRPRAIRHAGGQRRHPLGGGGGAAARADRLGPHPPPAAAGRDHRRRRGAGLGLRRAGGAGRPAGRGGARSGSAISAPPGGRRCGCRSG